MRKVVLAAWMAFVFITVSGCIVVGGRDQFEWSKESAVADGRFVPDTFMDPHTSRTYLPFFRIDLENPPHDLVLLLYDQTYEQSSEGMSHIIINSVTVKTESEGVVTILSEKEPLESRTYKIAKGQDLYGPDAKRRFAGAITSRESFTTTIDGTSISDSGEHFPFQRVETFRYLGRKWTVWTLYQELSGV